MSPPDLPALDDLHALPATELVRLLREGEVASVELLDHFLDRIDVDGEARSYFEGMYWAGGVGTLLLPVAVPPIGRTPDGLPVGVQVVAPHLHDRTAIAVAGHLEQLVGGFVPPPALAGAPAG
jgi:Asp-tRNA(Asn)/Glu-tRNA(Gln) amidotransferase A subunit family amidase